MSQIAQNLQTIKERIQQAAQKAQRNPDDIILIAATKGVPVPKIKQAIAAGINIIGENYVQEALPKYQEIGNQVAWHFIGHLQTNKVKYVVPRFQMVQTVDSLKLAQEINQRACKLNQTIDVLIEVNTSGEPQKFGAPPQQLLELVKQLAPLQALKIKGLMTMGFFTTNPEQVRPCFKLLKELANQITAQKIENIKMQYLSMGMTNDFEVAIQEGANIIRIGTAIFGTRNT